MLMREGQSDAKSHRNRAAALVPSRRFEGATLPTAEITKYPFESRPFFIFACIAAQSREPTGHAHVPQWRTMIRRFFFCKSLACRQLVYGFDKELSIIRI
jgi:hypothetical protein